MTITITVRETKAALAQIKKLTPARPRLDDDLKLSLKEAVLLMAPELSAMTKRGFTLKELADGLQAQKIPIKPATLNRYLNECKVEQTEAGDEKTPKKEKKDPPAKPEVEAAKKSAGDDKKIEAESKAEETRQSKDTGPQSETEREKSENPPSNKPASVEPENAPKELATATEAGEKTTKEEKKDPPGKIEAEAAKESVGDDKRIEAESKPEEARQSKDTGPQSETARDEYETPPSPFWSAFGKSQEQKSARPARKELEQVPESVKFQ